MASPDRLPRASSITSAHIVNAYVFGGEHAQRRIETYGRLNRKILRNIGKPAKQDGTTAKK